MILAVDKLCKNYQKIRVLIDCSFSMETGQCVLLRGPSGSGKSTLLRSIALLEDVDSGKIIHDKKVWSAGVAHGETAYPFLTVVFQQLFLWPNLTMAQNLALVVAHRPNALLPQKALDVLGRFAVLNVLGKYPHECSLGERQRLAVARALISDAQFILLDEPSSALDRKNTAILVQEISAARDSNRGILVVTHDDQSFTAFADKTFELEDGRLYSVTE